jgi:serine/threonine protein phosphatase PrpC
MSFPWIALGASVRGQMHRSLGQKNQDAVRLGAVRGPAGALLLAVADGHGSMRSFRSERGSAFATECALRGLCQLVRRHGPEASLAAVRRDVKNLWLRSLLAEWRAAVRADVRAHPFSPLDFAAFPDLPPVASGGELPPNAYLAYGATLIVCAITRRYLVYAQIGDGDILAIDAHGKVGRPLAKRHEFFANQTSSLCTSHAFEDFQVKVEPVRAGGPRLVMLSTDGYANCFGRDESFFQVGGDFLAYLREHGVGFVREHLHEWLRESSREGSGDDITVGLAVRATALDGR